METARNVIKQWHNVAGVENAAQASIDSQKKT